MTIKEYLINEIKMGNTVNLGRSIPESYRQEILNQTLFLSNPRNFNENIYCYINDIKELQLDIYGEPARFININDGYSRCIVSAVKELKGAISSFKKRHRTLMHGIRTSIRKENPRVFNILNYRKNNRIKNEHLYCSTLKEGHDYLVCPVSRERVSLIKRNYIENVLLMPVHIYDFLYPDTKGSSAVRIENIKEGLQTIDITTGKTAHQIAQQKRQIKLKTVDENGLSGYDKIGIKTRAAHMNNIDEFGRTGYQRQVYHRLTTILDNGLSVEENAHIKRNEKMILDSSRKTGASRISKKILKPLIDFLVDHNIKYYFDKQEYAIKDPDSNKYYFYDLTIPEFNLTVEYQSNAWHADPNLTEAEWNSWSTPRGKKKTAKEVLKYDYDKARALFKHRNIVTYYVWENSSSSDIEELLCLFKTLNMKY